jgi:predicted transcriptional regulator
MSEHPSLQLIEESKSKLQLELLEVAQKAVEQYISERLKVKETTEETQQILTKLEEIKASLVKKSGNDELERGVLLAVKAELSK